ncbi:MAG: hypothetical protein ABF289_04465 [Clostridiales bacterium]
MENKNQVQKILKGLNIEKFSSSCKKGTESISKISKNITTNIIKNVHDKSNDLISSIKHARLKNLEVLLKLDKSSKINSNKKCHIYQTSDKTIIIDIDMWGDPTIVTTKSLNSAKIQVVKYIEDEPYIYPNFNEKNIFGQIINLEENEIWYNDSGTIVMLKFFGSEYNLIKLKLNISREYSYKDLNNDSDFKSYLKNCSLTYRDKNLLDFLESKKMVLSNIIYINKTLIIYKTQNNQFQVIILKDNYSISEKFVLTKLPFKNENALKSLFSKEIVAYVKSNDYNFEDFILNGDFIEYWKFLGSKKVCLLKCDISN